jgi:replicative DNA helicase
VKHAEQTLLSHLSNPDSLDYIAREGLLTESGRKIIPSPEVSVLVRWALDEFFASGRMVAPSVQALRETWADHLEQFSITVDDSTEPDSAQWAVADLRANYARLEAEQLVNDFAKAMTEADGPQRVEVFQSYSDRMFVTAQSLVSRRNEMDGQQGVEDALLRLGDRIANGHTTRGLTLGIPEIDAHTFGVHPGEICTIASAPGLGKSWMAGYITLNAWRRGQRVLHVTLENDVPMTYDRLCCMAIGVDYDRWQRGEVTTEQQKAVFHLLDQMTASDNKPLIAQLELSQRTASGIVRKAMLEGAQGVVLDQLSFVDAEAGSRARQRNEKVSEIMFRLKQLVNEGVYRVPTIVFSQLKREGIKASRQSGRYHMDDLADSSAIEQTSDVIWVIFQSEDMKVLRTVQFQELKSRRTRTKHFQVSWRPEIGFIKVTGEVTL